MADKQFDVTPEQQRNFHEKQKQRLALRDYYLKSITNPHRHATGEGGALFDASTFRFMAMRAKEYDHFRPTPTNAFYAFCLVGVPMIIYSYAVYRERSQRENAIRNGEISYRDRKFKLI